MVYAKIYFGEAEDEKLKTTHRVVADVSFFGHTKKLVEMTGKELVDIEDELGAEPM